MNGKLMTKGAVFILILLAIGCKKKDDSIVAGGTGKVFGEFQDSALFENKAITKPAIKTWNDQQVYDGITGATIYKITRPDPIPPRTVTLADTTVAVSDGFGQYYFQIKSGTYLITGSCDGYTNVTKQITVLPDSSIYVNFFLKKK